MVATPNGAEHRRFAGLPNPTPQLHEPWQMKKLFTKIVTS
jgi:hypothetical protein